MAHLENLSALVIAANQGMRAQLRDMLEGFDIGDIQFAQSANAAVRRLRERRFDLIVCEHDLGDDSQDGQHLLEDLRSRSLIPPETLFIMISSERNYERVVGAAELTPDDYILKPLTPGTFRVRLERAVQKRAVFLPAHRLIEAGELEEALDYCLASELSHPAYRLELMRLRAQIHAGQRQFREADAIYLEILEARSIPWAQFGHARMLFESGRGDEAERILETLVAEHPYYLDAYDLLARTRENAGRHEQACEALASAIGRSPYRVGRLRRYGETATLAGNYDEAEKALQEVVRRGKYSEFRDPEDHIRLVKTQLLHGRGAEAEATLADLDKTMGTMAEARACSALGKALVKRHAGDAEGARIAASAAAHAARGADALSNNLKHDIIGSCLDNQLENEGIELASDILRNAADEHTVERTRTVLRERGRDDLSALIEKHLHAEVRGYIENGARKAKAGDYDGAVAEMMSAVRKMPGNPHVLFNAALALLRHIEHNGWNERFAAQARTLIARTRRLDPANPKLQAISGFMQDLVKKYGNSPQSVSGVGDKRATGLPG